MILVGGLVLFLGYGAAWAQVLLPAVKDPKPGINYYLQTYVSAWSLHVNEGKVRHGGDLCQGVLDPKQVWQLIPSTRHPGYFHIRTQLPASAANEPFRFLTVFKGNHDVGGRVCLTRQKPDDVWRLLPAKQFGYFHIESRVSGLTLDVTNGSLTPGERVGQAKKHPLQAWGFVAADRPERRLLIVAPRAFTKALSVFVAHKKRLLPTRLVALQTILASSPGADDAEKLKRYLYDQWRSHALGYVLLVGDPAIMPIRYRAVCGSDPSLGKCGFSPVDMYYADLARRDGSFDDWNAVKKGYQRQYYGTTMLWEQAKKEPCNFDRIDYLPDVAVGRWPVRTATEARLLAAKTIRYERAVLADDPVQVRRVGFICGGGYVDARRDMDAMAARLEAHSGCLSMRLYYGKDANFFAPEPSQHTIKGMLQRGVGLVIHTGHGNRGAWAEGLQVGRVAALRNAGLPPVIFSLACDAGIFAALPVGASYVDSRSRLHAGTDKGEVFRGPPPAPSPYQRGETCLATELLRGGPGGAVAYIGAAAGANGRDWPLMPGFIQYLVVCPEPRLGDAWNAAQTYFYKTSGFDDAMNPGFGRSWEFDQGLLFHLLGDPSLRLPRSPTPSREFVSVDLQSWANERLRDGRGARGNFNCLPGGKHLLGGIPFTIGRGLIRVAGKGQTDAPARVNGIKVGAKAKHLYFLHATHQTLEPGKVIGYYVVHYDDHSSRRLPIAYGKDLADYWYAPDSEGPTDAIVAWTGTHPAAGKAGRRIRLYQSGWKNPYPQLQVESLDFVAAGTAASPFCVAITRRGSR
jgi:hypothetical protein